MTTEDFKKDIIPYVRKLYPLINNILRDEEESHDAVQELMLKLWSKRKELSKCKNRSAYIITVSKNYCFDLLKKKKPERINQNEEYKILNIQATESKYEEKEKYENVRQIIEKLPDKYKTVIKLREIDGFTFDEIKEMTGFDIPYIRVILSRSRQRIKNELEKIYNYGQGEKLAQKIL